MSSRALPAEPCEPAPYERFRIDGIDFVVSGGGGAPLNDVRGKAGKHPDLYDGPRRFHYLKVAVADDVRVETIMLDERGASG